MLKYTYNIIDSLINLNILIILKAIKIPYNYYLKFLNPFNH